MRIDPTLTTPHLTDACLHLHLPVRQGPFGMQPVLPGTSICGRAVVVRHYGSVDVFLEALDHAEPGDVLLVDNGGRTDEACVGDLVAIETMSAGLAGIVIWGAHRDAAEIRRIHYPVFSLGAMPSGPRRLDPRDPDPFDFARCGEWQITRADFVAADDNGVLFLDARCIDEIFAAARVIRDRETGQAARVSSESLRSQLRFAEYLEGRRADPALTFRKHLRKLAGEIEA